MMIRDNKKRRVEDRVEPIESILVQKTTIKGNLQSEYGIRIWGSVEGDIESGGRVKIEAGGQVRGMIKANNVIVNGVLEGNIDAQGQIELGHESRVIGNVKAAKIAIADGCYFQGKIKMFHEDSQPVRFKEKRTSTPSGSSTPKKDNPI